ncbi:Hypothetical_protein [Hexamita inflata]|uniref:Hypothetical_protein n=1 Tax=Hexamita inflata TaxID=28002 RepID=A0AA86QBQ9_9EUKA|nr:Hypothetical protein HINF_LOCUS43520 [Hexamita inflata]
MVIRTELTQKRRKTTKAKYLRCQYCNMYNYLAFLSVCKKTTNQILTISLSYSTESLLLTRHFNVLDFYQTPDNIASLRLFQIIITTGASGTIMKSSKDAAKICKIFSSTNFRLNNDISPNHEGGQDVRNQQVGLSQTY